MDKLIYGTAYWLQGKIKSTTIIKVSLILLALSIPLSWVFGVKIVIAALVVNQVVNLVLEYLYARNEEISSGG